MHEVDEKTERLICLAHEAGVAGIVITTQPNFAWLTGGRSNRIDGSREEGSGSLLVTAAGERYAIANNIEMPRLQDEALAGLGFQPVDYPWTSDHTIPNAPIHYARQILGQSASIGCDARMDNATSCEAAIASARAPLTMPEVDRYRRLGRDIGDAVGNMCRALAPGLSERDVALRNEAAAQSVGARAIVSLVAADDRIARYRHPVPTEMRWQRSLLIVLCAERDGLVVALTRIVSSGPLAPALIERTQATAQVFEQLLEATRPDVTGADLFAVATRAYEHVGHAGEERLHHQGGAIGYRSRDWIAHAGSTDVVRSPQAYAWNPSITGTKVEDTALVTADGVELLTSTPGWPAIPIRVGGRSLAAAGILSL
jgi:Xaa-Pro aminopeptidase